MGIIFAAVIAVKLFSKELKDGTYEFIYANPISRVKIFISKSLVVVLYLVVLNVMVFLVGFASIEVLKTKSPIMPWLSDENIEMLESKLSEDSSKINAFDRDEDLFYDVFYSNLSNQYEMASEVQEIDDNLISDLLGVFISNPDGIFDEMLSNKEKYMILFGYTEGQEEIYIKTMEVQKSAYFTFKEQFATSDDVALELFKNNPAPFLNQIVKDEKVESFKIEMGLTDKQSENLFIYYSFSNFVEHSTVTFLVMLCIAMFVMMLTVVIPKGLFTSGLATGVCMVIYLLNMMSNIAEPIRFLRYFTPLSYVNMDVMAVDYQTETWSLIVILAVIIVSYVVSIISIKRSDLIT
jgi:hypothetical protein